MKVWNVRHLEALFDGGTVVGLSDELLLERFARCRDGPAFEAIVARHGPMVFNVYRRILPNRSDVDDAFQATFLILVRKAGTIRDNQRLSSWLYGVAHRVASRARAQSVRRGSRERPATGEAAVESSGEVERRELLAVLDEEVTRLPEKFRAAVVLCDLEGKTYEEAARRLDCALGTLKSRLASARKRLRGRLIRRVLAPAAATLAADLAASSASAKVPAQLSELTVHTALRSLTCWAVGAQGTLVTVAVLTEGVLKAMLFSRLKTIGAAILAASACAASLGVLAQTPTGSQYDKPIRQLEEQLHVLKRRRDIEAAYKADRDKATAALLKRGATLEWDVVTVNLSSSNATDDDLKYLSALPKLLTLYLHHNPITDAGVANLKGLRNLTTLDLFDTRVTDGGLMHLSEWMPHLERLELSDTSVTDACLGPFKGLKNLRHVDVRRTKVTEAGADELRRALPGVEIRR